MLQNRQKPIVLCCVAIVILLVLVPAFLAQFPTPSPTPHKSELCQMEYADRTMAGKPAWEVTSIMLGPDGGKLGEMQFLPGDIIVKVGNWEVETGVPLDLMIRKAIIEQQRTITLRDPKTGYEVVYSF